MGRLGVDPEDLYPVCSALKSSPHLLLEGLSTHLASSEVLDAPSVNEQLQKFEQVRSVVRNEGFDPPLIHVANTGAVISRRESWNTMVRPGIALYGYHLPFERAGREVSGARCGSASNRCSPGKPESSRCAMCAPTRPWAMAELM